MSLDILAIIWFLLWGLIWIIYFITDGYTLGAGMLTPFVAKDADEQQQIQESVGPFWSGNEVWLVTAGGVTFAAFPLVYATMFSSLYEALILLLGAIFFRSASLELMLESPNLKWQKLCKWTFCITSVLIALLLGVTFGNLFIGLPIGEHGYDGSFFGLLGRYQILVGVLFISMFFTSGSLWLQLKTDSQVATNSYIFAKVGSILTLILTSLVFLATLNASPEISSNYNNYPLLYIIPTLALVFGCLSVAYTFSKDISFAFGSICFQILFIVAFGLAGMFPNMLISSIDPIYSLTALNASATEPTLNYNISKFIVRRYIFIVISI